MLSIPTVYDFRDELTTQDDLVFEGSLVVVRTSIPTEGDDGTMPRDPHWCRRMCKKGPRIDVLASDGNRTQGVCAQV